MRARIIEKANQVGVASGVAHSGTDLESMVKDVIVAEATEEYEKVIAFAGMVSEENGREMSARVADYINKMRRSPEAPILPIDWYLQEIWDLSQKHQVVIVEGEPGSGKTTQLPNWLMEMGQQVTVTQVKRMAVRAMSKRIAWERQEVLGEAVGYRLFGDKNSVTPKKEIRTVFRMDQSLVNQIRRTGKLPEGVIMVDEAHERTTAIDIVLMMIKKLLPSSPKTRLIITSATFDTKKFSDYFWGAPVLKVEGRCYPVEVWPITLTQFEHHTQGVARVAEDVLNQYLKGELTIQDKEDLSKRVMVTSGKLGLILPGEKDIEEVILQLTRYVKKLQEEGVSVRLVASELTQSTMADELSDEAKFTVELLPCHGKLTGPEQDKVLKSVPENNFQIVVGTEIVRSSLTLPNTICIIDCLQVKRFIVNSRRVGRLTKISISKAEADQAKGRAGRTQPGIYIPVGVEYSYLKPYPTPAMLQEPLTSVVLQLTAAEIDPRNCDYLDAPGETSIDATIKRLQKIGALDAEEKITELGKILVQIASDPELAKTLIQGSKEKVLPELVLATAGIEVEGVKFVPRPDFKILVDRWVVEKLLEKEKSWHEYSLEKGKEKLPDYLRQKGGHYEVDGKKLGERQGARVVADMIWESWTDTGSDFVAIIKAFRAYKAEERWLRNKFKKAKGGHKKAQDALYSWCKRNCLSKKKLDAINRSVQMLHEQIETATPFRFRLGEIYAQRKFDGGAITRALASGMIDSVGSLESGRYGDYDSPKGEFQISHNSICSRNAELVLSGGLRKIPGRRDSLFNISDLNAPLKIEWLQEIMPQFCTYKPGHEVKFDGERDSVISSRIVYYNDIQIGEDWVPNPEYSMASEIFAGWFNGFYKSDNPEFNRVIEHNSKIDFRAEELNRIAGKRIFPIHTHMTKGQFYREKFESRGIRCMADIKNWDELLFPELDPEEVARVKTENPSKIEILGKLRTVDYGSDGVARIRIDKKEALALDENFGLPVWTQFRDGDFELPGGRKIQLTVGNYGDFSCSSTNGKDIKSKLLNKANLETFRAWTDRPEIEIPRIESEDQIPEIAEVVFGTCSVYETPLTAYGTVISKSYLVSSSSGFCRKLELGFRWYQTREEAEKKNERTADRLEARRRHLRRETALAEIQIPDTKDYESIIQATIPEPVEIEGGYGVIEAKMHWSDFEGFRVAWKNSLDSAMRAWNDSVRELERKKEEAERKRFEAERRDISERIRETHESPWFIHLSDEDRTEIAEIDDNLNSYDFSGDLLAEMERAKAAVLKAETAYHEMRQAWQQQERAKEEAGKNLRKIFQVCPLCGKEIREDYIDFESVEKSCQEADSGDTICDCFFEDEERIIKIVERGRFKKTVCSRNEGDVVARVVTPGGKVAAAMVVFVKWGRWNCRLQAYPENYEAGELKLENHFQALREATEDSEVATKDIEAKIPAKEEVGDDRFEKKGEKNDGYFTCPRCGRTVRLTKRNHKAYKKGHYVTIACGGCPAKGTVHMETPPLPNPISVSESALASKSTPKPKKTKRKKNKKKVSRVKGVANGASLEEQLRAAWKDDSSQSPPVR